MLIKIFTDGKYEISFYLAGKFLNIFFYHNISFFVALPTCSSVLDPIMFQFRVCNKFQT